MAFVLAINALAAQQKAQLSYTPAFFWSPRGQASPSAGAAPIEHHAALSGVDVERVAAMLVDGDSAQPAPEVQLVFLAEGLGTEAVRQHGARLPALDKLLQSSTTSLTMPFTTAHDSKLFAHAGARVAGREAEAYLESHASLFDNGAADTLVVDLPAAGETVEEQLAAHDAHIERVTRTVHARTGGNYVALLTAKRGSPTSHRRLGSAAPPPAYLHTTPTLLTAQVVMLLLMTIFLSGFCCLFSLQTPKKFNDTAKEAS